MTPALGLYLGVGLVIAGYYQWLLSTDEEEARDFDRETGFDLFPDTESLRLMVLLIASPILPLMAVMDVLGAIWRGLRGDRE